MINAVINKDGNFKNSILQKSKNEDFNFCSSIVEKSITPFEKFNKNFEQGRITNPSLFNYYLSYWIKVLSSEGKKEKLEQFLRFANLNEKKVHQMFAPAKLKNFIHPEWSQVLNDIIKCNFVGTDPVIDQTNPIPFEELYIPFIESYRQRLKEMAKTSINEISLDAHRNIERLLLERIAVTMQSTLLEEFHSFMDSKSESSEGLENSQKEKKSNHHFRLFIEKNQKDNLKSFFSKYPMLARIICNDLLLFTKAIGRFLLRLQKDKKSIQIQFNQLEDIGMVRNLSMDISDLHNGGESVIILEFDSGFKLVYKPRCLKISESYEGLCNWINEKVDIKLKITKVLSRNDYGWMEFVPNKPCNNESEVKEYYERAGIILAVTHFLGGTDYHAENIIASGNNPVLIDHETLLQPQVKIDVENLTAEQKKRLFLINHSILRTNLLPIYSKSTGVNSDILSGFGSIKNQDSVEIPISYINHINTDSMRYDRKVITKVQNSNLPTLNGKVKRITEYQVYLENGFKKMYSIFENEREYLKKKNSPIYLFKNIKLRFLFRSTQIYSTIISSLLRPKFLKDANIFGLRLEFISRAFLREDTKPEYWLLNEREREEMLNRDIPFFSLNSDSEVLMISEEKKIDSYFSYSCIKAIEEKLANMGKKDMEAQLEIIRDSIQGKFNKTNW